MYTEEIPPIIDDLTEGYPIGDYSSVVVAILDAKTVAETFCKSNLLAMLTIRTPADQAMAKCIALRYKAISPQLRAWFPHPLV